MSEGTRVVGPLGRQIALNAVIGHRKINEYLEYFFKLNVRCSASILRVCKNLYTDFF